MSTWGGVGWAGVAVNIGGWVVWSGRQHGWVGVGINMCGWVVWSDCQRGWVGLGGSECQHGVGWDGLGWLST